jgi:hypothetical protein
VDQATFDALEQRYGTQWLVELTAVMGYFAMVSGIANAFEVAAPAGGDKLPGAGTTKQGPDPKKNNNIK